MVLLVALGAGFSCGCCFVCCWAPFSSFGLENILLWGLVSLTPDWQVLQRDDQQSDQTDAWRLGFLLGLRWCLGRMRSRGLLACWYVVGAAGAKSVDCGGVSVGTRRVARDLLETHSHLFEHLQRLQQNNDNQHEHGVVGLVPPAVRSCELCGRAKHRVRWVYSTSSKGKRKPSGSSCFACWKIRRLGGSVPSLGQVRFGDTTWDTSCPLGFAPSFAHNFREVWRSRLFRKWLASSRRDAAFAPVWGAGFCCSYGALA